MDCYAVPLPGSDLPAWFGKLPGMGDFAQRRTTPHFLQVWDSWLQCELSQLKIRQHDWVARYLSAPLWFFTLGPKVVGVHPWIGVLMPSVDSVGRYFPLGLFIELKVCNDDLPCSAARICSWWTKSARAALLALETDLHASAFDGALNEIFTSSASIENNEVLLPYATMPPEEGVSHWFTDEGLMIESRGLPQNTEFEALFANPDTPIAQR